MLIALEKKIAIGIVPKHVLHGILVTASLDLFDIIYEPLLGSGYCSVWYWGPIEAPQETYSKAREGPSLTSSP